MYDPDMTTLHTQTEQSEDRMSVGRAMYDPDMTTLHTATERSEDRMSVGRAMYDLVEELYPMCRSITGEGVRQTLRTVARLIPLVIHEIPTGARVFDWVVPKEWNVADAFIKDAKGNRVVDFRKSNLHVVNYSSPVHRWMPLDELKAHLHTLPEHPDWIPYRTSYYKEDWGFCVSRNQLSALSGEEYEVCIDSTLEDGSLTFGEYYLPGDMEDEVLLSCHTCHPSLCNDNLSGIALLTFLASSLAAAPRRYSYRFLFIPGTIGAVAWLALNQERTTRIRHGLVAACVGDRGKFTYKKSRNGNVEIDRAAIHILRTSGAEHEIVDFSPYGYNERQFCSPGFDLPVGCLTRTPHGRLPEYHTSADNLDLVSPEHLAGSLFLYRAVLEVLEKNKLYESLNPKCEPQLGRRGLYDALAGDARSTEKELAMLWVLNLSDGRHTLLDIAERSNLPFGTIHHAASLLETHGLLRECGEQHD
jgi:aminopeptidase-like protein